MRKFISLLLVSVMLFLLCACTATPEKTATPAPTQTPEETVTPEPTFPAETVKVSDLGEYTIVYPASYVSWQMTEVTLLQTVLSKITGKSVNAVPDTTPASGKEIIFASTGRKTKLDEYVSSFESRLDYVIGVTDGNIVLGGQDYYGNMRAAYKFINEILGYDDLEDKYGTPKENVTGVEKTTYVKPGFIMAAAAFYKHIIPSAKAIKEIKDCNFNTFVVQGMTKPYEVLNEDGTVNVEASSDNFREVCLWCARFGITLIMPINVNKETFDFELRYLPAYEDNPVVWGHYLVDEPELNYSSTDFEKFGNIATEYKKRYSDKGWKCLCNFTFYTTRYESYITGTFSDADVLCLDYYFFHGKREISKHGKYSYYDDDNAKYVEFFPAKGQTPINEREVLHHWEKQYAETKKNGQDFWSYITAFYFDKYNVNTNKMFRWNEYMNLCFGPKALLYFNYSGWVVSNQYEKIDPYWDDARLANGEVLKIGEMLVKDYEYIGTHEENVDPNDYFMYLEADYPYFVDIVSDFVVPEGDKSPYLFGLYKKKDTKDGYSFIIVNCSPLDNVKYEDTTAEPVKLKIDGNATFYLNGEVQNVEKDADGYYSIMCGNGYAWFVTVEG